MTKRTLTIHGLNGLPNEIREAVVQRLRDCTADYMALQREFSGHWVYARQHSLGSGNWTVRIA